MSGQVAFSRGGTLALVAVGFALFLALIWLIASGEDFGGGGNNGQAHAASKGLNGYAGLARLLEADGFGVTRSRSPSGLETEGLLVLTPPPGADPKEMGKILRNREMTGPTLVILPKWNALRPPQTLPREVRSKFKPGWVMLFDAQPAEWTADLPSPYGFTHQVETLEKDEEPGWDGFAQSGNLPTRTILYADESDLHEPLITDSAGHWLALRVLGEQGSDYYEDAHWTIFVAEPDLLNNYGLADRTRAAAALALLREAAYDGDIDEITFDLTLNGFGASENLLTLAFRPPFLAATLCLLLALLIVGWRAFQRFGPPAAANGPAIAFGKERLIANGAGLILRARRFGLLAAPYAALSAREIAQRLGLARPDPEAIDAALARRLPSEEPFSRRIARLEAAHRPADILDAARALDDLNHKL
ncbi:DUF4350 domain-containing protein [Erythrobacter sp. sf7]|uniref:DUF4350 domain-containing protein n=1 Tax=Erythrobacter fulvus TaxID=2987523 RepID=A0ABT5JQF7_9SPHN|nr:DUF4350 domain-containing protein [Erythrobacter fulvus]MDC8754914.1 DUF4350 domain-containing protein [Erythrobacter fulvus]